VGFSEKKTFNAFFGVLRQMLLKEIESFEGCFLGVFAFMGRDFVGKGGFDGCFFLGF